MFDVDSAVIRERPPSRGDNPTSLPAGRLCCRPIRAEDLDSIVAFLHAGFPRRSPSDFRRLLITLGSRPVCDKGQQYGHMLSCGSTCVGVLLTITSQTKVGVETVTRCNVACWHVHPHYAMFGGMLLSRVLKDAPAIVLNVSPAKSTLPTIEAQGFTRLSSGLFAALPLLSYRSEVAHLVPPEAYDSGQPGFDAEMIGLLKRHTEYGCISFLIRANGRLYPFIFRRRVVRHFPVPCAQLVYAAGSQSLIACARLIGSLLLRRGLLWMLVAGSGPIASIPGVYFPGRSPIYVRTRLPTNPYDLADTELALFGA